MHLSASVDLRRIFLTRPGRQLSLFYGFSKLLERLIVKLSTCYFVKEQTTENRLGPLSVHTHHGLNVSQVLISQLLNCE